MRSSHGMDDSPDMPPPYGFYPPGKKLIFKTFKTKKIVFRNTPVGAYEQLDYPHTSPC